MRHGQVGTEAGCVDGHEGGVVVQMLVLVLVMDMLVLVLHSLGRRTSVGVPPGLSAHLRARGELGLLLLLLLLVAAVGKVRKRQALAVGARSVGHHVLNGGRHTLQEAGREGRGAAAAARHWRAEGFGGALRLRGAARARHGVEEGRHGCLVLALVSQVAVAQRVIVLKTLVIIRLQRRIL